jgi:hypothetical protein
MSTRGNSKPITEIVAGLGAVVLCLALGASASTSADTSSASPQRPHRQIKVQPKPASLSHLYWHFLMYQNHLDRTAAQHVNAGKEGTWLSGHFQKQLGLTDAQMAAVRASAQRLNQELIGIGAQMKTVLQTDRMLYAKHLIAPNTPPPGRPQVLSLKNQREALIGEEIATLNKGLGPEAASRLKNFLETDFARSVNVYDARVPSHSDVRPTHRLNTEAQ